jgi:REP element-mobilizing transposase RayT
MPRHPRYLEPGRPVVITQRCFQSRFLLRPSKVVNALILGVLAMAQRLYGMQIHYVVVLSNHLHLLASPDSLEQLEAFQRFLGSNISKEVGREQG